MYFKDRNEAGQKLAKVLAPLIDKETVVYALPRGGVVLGYEIAKTLKLPLDIIITRKIGHPAQPEYAICAVAEDGHELCNEIERTGVDEKWFAKAKKEQQQEAKRRHTVYRADLKIPVVDGKTAILVDDGIATGLTIRLAIGELRHLNPKRLIVAVPVAPADVVEQIQKTVDKLVMLDTPVIYAGAVGNYYENFPQIEDGEVIKLLNEIAGQTQPLPLP
jgi:putative phosphoribosyl transferase